MICETCGQDFNPDLLSEVFKHAHKSIEPDQEYYGTQIRKSNMNVDDVKAEGSVNSIEAMFAKQRELMDKYDSIESRNGATVPEPPYNLDSRAVQCRIKDLFWRVTEELAEAAEAVKGEEHHLLEHWKTAGNGRHNLEHWKSLWDTHSEVRHYFEELADAIHFMVEASILSGLDPKLVESKVIGKPLDTHEELGSLHWNVVYYLGLAANCLKNKPWKQTEVPTDVEKFRRYLLDAWTWLQVLWTELKCELPDILSLYERKWGVNRWRQITQY